MKEKKIEGLTEKQRNIIYSLIVTAIYFGFLFLVLDFSYSEEDAFFCASLSGKLNGLYDAHLIYTKYIFGILISLFYKFIPIFNWYGIVMWTIILGAFFLAIYRLLTINMNNSYFIRVLEVVGFITVYTATFLYGYIEFNFTYPAATTAITAIFYMVTFSLKEELGTKANFICIVGNLVLCYWIRYEVALIALCICIGIMGFLFWEYGRKYTKAIITFFCVIGFFVMITQEIEHFVYSSDEQTMRLEYDQNRSLIHDYYGWPDYKDAQEIFDAYGLGETDAKLLQKGVYVLREKDTMYSFVKGLALYLQEQGTPKTFSGLKVKIINKFLEFGRYWTNSEYVPVNMLILALSIILIILYEIKNEKQVKALYVFGALLAYCAMWCYLIWKGRINAHAIIPLQSIFFVFFFGNAVVLLAEKSKINLTKKWLIGAVFTFFGGCAFIYYGLINYNFSLREARDAKFAEKVLEYANNTENIVYYTSTYYTSRKMGLFNTPNNSDMLYAVHDLSKPNIEELLKESRYYMVSEEEQNFAFLLEKALEERGYLVKAEIVDSITQDSYKVLVYQFLEEE